MRTGRRSRQAVGSNRGKGITLTTLGAPAPAWLYCGSDVVPIKIYFNINHMTASIQSFATAVQPIVEETVIVTDGDGLIAGDINISTTDGSIPAYRAAPAAGDAHPVVLVVQEIFGVHEHIKDVCRRLAKLGYLAIAPELYARQGEVAKLASVEEIRKVVAAVPDAQVLSDLDASLAWAARNSGDADRLGITGFCWGGRITWLYTCHQAKVKAGVAWYGKLTGETSRLTPAFPVQLAGQLKAPVLGLYGGQDQGIPLDDVEKMKAALKESGSASTIRVYSDAPHAFYADYRPSYRKDAATDGWQRLQSWFRQHGV
jgi:carboxymethylenebutenolidase